MEMISRAAVARRLRRREQVQEGKQFGQILPTAEVIMKKKNDKQSCRFDKTQKERSSPGREAVGTDAPNSGGHHEKWNTTRLRRHKVQKERSSPGREAVRTDPPNSGGHYEKRQ